jgi:RNA polymerase sigma factor (TIGR02999 family)
MDDELLREGLAWVQRLAPQIMRRILVDCARSQQSAKRGGKQGKVSLDEVLVIVPNRTEELLAIHECLERVERLDSRQSRLVELRYFGGLTLEETARVLGVSSKTVMRDWNAAKAWLYGALKEWRGNDAGPME